MEIQPSNSVGQATALFTGWTQEEVQNEIARIYPYPTINTLLFSKNTQEAITSTGAHKDFNEKNLIEGHRMLQGFITNPFQSVQDIPQSKADPFYYDAGLSEIQDLQQNTIGHPTGIPEVQDPRTAFIANQLKARIFRGQVDNELSKDYLNNLWLSQIDKGATYYQAQAIKQNEALNKYTADKLNAIRPIGSDTYIRNVNMGTINEKPHKDIKRNVVVRATPIHTSSSRHAKLNRLHNRFNQTMAQLDEDEKQIAGHVGNTQGTHPLLQLQNPNTHNMSHVGHFPHVYTGTNQLAGHAQHGDEGSVDSRAESVDLNRKRTRSRTDQDETFQGRPRTESPTSDIGRLGRITKHYEDQIASQRTAIAESEALLEKYNEEDEKIAQYFKQFRQTFFTDNEDQHQPLIENIISPFQGKATPGILNQAMIEDGVESKQPDPSSFITPTSSPSKNEGDFNTASRSFKNYWRGSSTTGGTDSDLKSATQKLQETRQQTEVHSGMPQEQLEIHFVGEMTDSKAAQVFSGEPRRGDPFTGDQIYNDEPPPTRTPADARYAEQKYTPPEKRKPIDVTNIPDLLEVPLIRKRLHQDKNMKAEKNAIEYYKEKDSKGKEYRGGVEAYKEMRAKQSELTGSQPFMVDPPPLPSDGRLKKFR